MLLTKVGFREYRIKSKDKTIAIIPIPQEKITNKIRTNVNFIVRACNNHEKLVETIGKLHDKFLYMRSYLETRMRRSEDNELDIALKAIELANQVIQSAEED